MENKLKLKNILFENTQKIPIPYEYFEYKNNDEEKMFRLIDNYLYYELGICSYEMLEPIINEFILNIITDTIISIDTDTLQNTLLSNITKNNDFDNVKYELKKINSIIQLIDDISRTMYDKKIIHYIVDYKINDITKEIDNYWINCYITQYELAKLLVKYITDILPDTESLFDNVKKAIENNIKTRNKFYTVDGIKVNIY